jgi:hypothetical protein
MSQVPTEALLFHKGFQQIKRVALFTVPVRADTPTDPAQYMTCQMRDVHPGQNKKACVVRNPNVWISNIIQT